MAAIASAEGEDDVVVSINSIEKEDKGDDDDADSAI
jgi:hypothetical protein